MVVEEPVFRAHDGEHRGWIRGGLGTESDRRDRLPGREAQLRSVQVGDRAEVAVVDQPLRAVDVQRRIQVELSAQQIDHGGRHGRLHLQADRRGEAPLA